MEVIGQLHAPAALHPGKPLPVKGKFHPRIDRKGPEVEHRYSSTLSLTSALDGVGG
jgi:hypothetical protein